MLGMYPQMTPSNDVGNNSQHSLPNSKRDRLLPNRTIHRGLNLTMTAWRPTPARVTCRAEVSAADNEERPQSLTSRNARDDDSHVW